MTDHTHVVLSNDPPEASFGMPQCRNCRFWDREHEWLTEDVTWGVCVRASSDEGTPVDAYSLVYADDRMDDMAVMKTAPTFGCVQFQPKDVA